MPSKMFVDWSDAIEGSTENLGDEFTLSRKEIHYSEQKLVEVIGAKKVVWLVSKDYLRFTKDKSEWKGPQLYFEVSA